MHDPGRLAREARSRARVAILSRDEAAPHGDGRFSPCFPRPRSLPRAPGKVPPARLWEEAEEEGPPQADARSPSCRPRSGLLPGLSALLVADLSLTTEGARLHTLGVPERSAGRRAGMFWLVDPWRRSLPASKGGDRCAAQRVESRTRRMQVLPALRQIPCANACPNCGKAIPSHRGSATRSRHRRSPGATGSRPAVPAGRRRRATAAALHRAPPRLGAVLRPRRLHALFREARPRGGTRGPLGLLRARPGHRGPLRRRRREVHRRRGDGGLGSAGGEGGRRRAGRARRPRAHLGRGGLRKRAQGPSCRPASGS